jgi:hypothetical protein
MASFLPGLSPSPRQVRDGHGPKKRETTSGAQFGVGSSFPAFDLRSRCNHAEQFQELPQREARARFRWAGSWPTINI